MRRLGGAAWLVAAGLGLGACASRDTPPPPEAPAGSAGSASPANGQAIDQALMIALGQAKNLHHKAKLYAADGDTPAAIAAVREILALPFPAHAPEAEDVRADARALLAKLLLGQGELDLATRTVDEGIAASTRDSFFVANLYTVRGEIHEARAAQLAQADGSGGTATAERRAAATAERRAAIEAFDKSIQIDERLQKQLMEHR